MLYPLILLQYSTQTFYDPTRTACIPTVVPRQLICVASTLDMMGFSLMGLSAAVLVGGEGKGWLMFARRGLLLLAGRPVRNLTSQGPA